MNGGSPEGSGDLATAMAGAAADVNGVLDNLLPEPDGPEGQVFDAMRYAAMAPGKRFRPILVLASAELFNVARRSGGGNGPHVFAGSRRSAVYGR